MFQAMHSYLVTPASEAEGQFLASLFKKMRVKATLVPNSNGVATAHHVKDTSEAVFPQPVMARNSQEASILAAVAELNEILAGRKEAMSLDEFWAEVKAEAGADAR